MIHEQANEGKAADDEWHDFRWRAHQTAFSEEEFSDLERTRYNLDPDDDFAPMHITGEDNPETYEGDDVGPGDTDAHDIREDPWR